MCCIMTRHLSTCWLEVKSRLVKTWQSVQVVESLHEVGFSGMPGSGAVLVFSSTAGIRVKYSFLYISE